MCCVVSLRFLFMESMAVRLKYTHIYTEKLPDNRIHIHTYKIDRRIFCPKWIWGPSKQRADKSLTLRTASIRLILLPFLLCFGIYVCVVGRGWGGNTRRTRSPQQIYYIFVFFFSFGSTVTTTFPRFWLWLTFVGWTKGQQQNTVRLFCWRRDNVYTYMYVIRAVMVVIHTYIWTVIWLRFRWSDKNSINIFALQLTVWNLRLSYVSVHSIGSKSYFLFLVLSKSFWYDNWVELLFWHRNNILLNFKSDRESISNRSF